MPAEHTISSWVKPSSRYSLSFGKEDEQTKTVQVSFSTSSIK